MEYIIIYVPILVIILIFIYLSSKITQVVNKQDKQQKQIDYLMNSFGIVSANDPQINLSSESLRKVISLKEDGKIIQAIKEVRDETGVGLKEAKDYVDNL